MKWHPVDLLPERRVSLCVFLPLALALVINVDTWSTVLGFTSWPGVAMWPNQFITELITPWIVGITLNAETRMGFIYESVLYGIWIVGFIYLMRFLRRLRAPTLPEVLETWGVKRCGQILTIMIVCRRNVVYIFTLIRNMSLFQSLSGQEYCRSPLSCLTEELGDMSEQVLDGWQGYDDILGAILGIYLTVLRPGGCAVTRLPGEISTYFLMREPQFLAFSVYQILRFLASSLPRSIYSFQLRLIRIMQLPFQKALANRGLKARTAFSAFTWLIATTLVEIRLLVSLIPRHEWELQYCVLLLKIKAIFLWTVSSMFIFLIWNKVWTGNVTFPDFIKRPKFLGPIFDFLHRLLGYWDGFWRHGEGNPRDMAEIGQKEYMRGLNASDTFCRGLWYFVNVPFGLYYGREVGRGIILGSERGYRQLLWVFLVPTVVSMILDENFFKGKRNRRTFRYLRPDDDEEEEY